MVNYCGIFITLAPGNNATLTYCMKMAGVSPGSKFNAQPLVNMFSRVKRASLLCQRSKY